MSQMGIYELASPEGSRFDIVFVHGLFGNRIETWTGDNGTLWPQELLSKELTDVRILTFGYDADVTKFDLNSELTHGTMESHAADMCDRLAALRASTQSTDRPLIFIAHSLGGLVCAQMVVKAEMAGAGDNVSQIANATRGMIFLGTPFHGSPVAPWAKLISAMVSVIHATDSQKVRDLQEKSEKLRILAESFASVLVKRIKEREIRVAFFHETKKFRGILVVPELNARISGLGDHASIDGDHSAICKFSSADDPGFQIVLAMVRKMMVNNEGTDKDAGTGVKYVNTYHGKIGNQVNGTQNNYGPMNFN